MPQGVKINLSKEKLSEMLETKTRVEIAQELGVSSSTVQRYMQKYSLSSSKEIARVRNSEKHTRYAYDKDYFNSIDTMNKAYLLGFICADGFVTDNNEIGISVAKKDRAVIEFFKKELKSNKPIAERTSLEGHKSCGLRIQGVEIAKTIQEYKIVPRKSLILDIGEVIKLAKLNEKQISVFLLGYFDGDGCISSSISGRTGRRYWQMNVTGTGETINYYKQYFNNHGTISKRHRDTDSNNYTLSMSNNFSTIYNALSKIYQYKDELNFYLERKFKIFKELEDKVRL